MSKDIVQRFPTLGECSRYTNGLCSTRSCLIRGGWKQGDPVDYDLATCETRDIRKTIEALEAEVAALKSQLHEARENEKAAGKAYDEILLTKDAMRNELQAAEAQASRMRDALEKIVQGDYPRSGRNFYDATTRTPSKHDTCGHGKAYWDDCGNCCSSFARKALDEQ